MAPKPSYYYGPHLGRALACMDGGRPDYAVTWMERDLGEMGMRPGEMPEVKSLRVVRWADVVGEGMSSIERVIEYLTLDDVWKNVAGDGI